MLPGCAPSTGYPYISLIDQRTFRGTPVAPASADVKPLPALPLAVIRFDQPDDMIQTQLATAVVAAESRKPDVEFNVMAAVAQGQAPNERATGDAAQVARMLALDSVDPERIHVGIIEDAGTPAREVRVYVR